MKKLKAVIVILSAATLFGQQVKKPNIVHKARPASTAQATSPVAAPAAELKMVKTNPAPPADLSPVDRTKTDPGVLAAQKASWEAIGKMQFYRAEFAASLTPDQRTLQDKVASFQSSLPKLTDAIKDACKKIDRAMDVNSEGDCFVPPGPLALPPAAAPSAVPPAPQENYHPRSSSEGR